MQQSYYPLSDYPQLISLVDNWHVIKDEFKTLKAPNLHIDRAGKPHEQVFSEIFNHVMGGGEYGWMMGWGGDKNANPSWLQYALVIHDQAIPFVKGMDKTMALLSELVGIKVCALLKMKPHTYLPTHNHPEIEMEGLLQFHLTLDMAENEPFAYLNVNGEFMQNKPGRAVIFDGSKPHFALNASHEDRTILYMEFKKSSFN